MRTAKQTLSEFTADGVRAEAAPAGEADVTVFLASFASAWGKVKHIRRTESNLRQSHAAVVRRARLPTRGR
ncbi:hypothetical protein SAMN05446635_9997 [Burkholderia sp. OK233]|nr:hypothetical protein SAMN05446635_9997 [Burkholderia sp. OK233]